MGRTALQVPIPNVFLSAASIRRRNQVYHNLTAITGLPDLEANRSGSGIHASTAMQVHESDTFGGLPAPGLGAVKMRHSSTGQGTLNKANSDSTIAQTCRRLDKHDQQPAIDILRNRC